MERISSLQWLRMHLKSIVYPKQSRWFLFLLFIWHELSNFNRYESMLQCFVFVFSLSGSDPSLTSAYVSAASLPQFATSALTNSSALGNVSALQSAANAASTGKQIEGKFHLDQLSFISIEQIVLFHFYLFFVFFASELYRVAFQMEPIYSSIICRKSSPIQIWHRHFYHLAPSYRPKCLSTNKRIYRNVLVLFHTIIMIRRRLQSKQCMVFKLERND